MSARLLDMPFGLVAYAILVGVLVVISVVDWRTRRIPNAFIVVMLCLRAVVLVLDIVSGRGIFAVTILFYSLVNAFIVGTLLIATKIIVDKATDKESLGWGDVKLVAAGTLFLTASQIFVALVIACVAALALAAYFKHYRQDPTFPFGPALALGIAFAALL